MKKLFIILLWVLTLGLIAASCWMFFQKSNPGLLESAKMPTKEVVSVSTEQEEPTKAEVPDTEVPVSPVVPTETSTLVPIIEQPSAFKLLKNSECYQGPGQAYDIAKSLTEGEEYKLLGISEDASWVLLDNGNEKDNCWVAADNFDADFSGYNLDIVAAPPLPTVEAVEQPELFKLVKDADCYRGPGEAYDLEKSLKAGGEYKLLGISEDASWVILDNGDENENCWVAVDRFDADFSGYNLDVVAAPPLPTAVPVAKTQATGKARGLRYYLFRKNTGGQFGCGDSLIYYYPGVNATGKRGTDITRALQSLFRIKRKFVGEGYNPIYRSDLSVDKVSVNAKTNSANVYLSGTFVKPKNKCESKRIKEQITNTVLQFADIHSVRVWVNNKPLNKLLNVGKK